MLSASSFRNLILYNLNAVADDDMPGDNENGYEQQKNLTVLLARLLFCPGARFEHGTSVAKT